MVDSENVMFLTMNTVAMRTILHGSRMEMVRYVREALMDMSEHQHFPLRKARPDIGARQLFDTLFIYQKRPGMLSPNTQHFTTQQVAHLQSTILSVLRWKMKQNLLSAG